MDRPDLYGGFDELSHVDAADVRLCARALLRYQILREDGPKADLLPLVYRHRDDLRVLFSWCLGYRLDVERRFARLYKFSSLPGRGLRGFSARGYMYLALTLAALISAGRQILLSGLIAEIRGAAVDAGLRLGDSKAELRVLSETLRFLVRAGVLVETEGTVLSAQHHVFHDDFAEALITVDLDVLGLLMPKDDAGVPGLGADAGLELPVGVRARQHLVEDPVVLFADLPPDEEQYLRTNARQEAHWVERCLGLEVEIRAEGMAAIDTEGLLSDLPFPGGSTVSRLSLLALPALLAEAEPYGHGMLSVTDDILRTACLDLVARHSVTWSKRETANLDRLVGQVAEHLRAAGVARLSETGALLLVPAAFRWNPVAEHDETRAPAVKEYGYESDESGPHIEETLF
jgi:hypothetical protein